MSLAAMSVAGVSAAAVGVVLGCSAANNLEKAASRRLLLLAVGAAGVVDAAGVVVLVAGVLGVSVAVVVTGVVAGVAAAEAAATLPVAAVAVDDAAVVALATGAPNVWASCPMRCARSP